MSMQTKSSDGSLQNQEGVEKKTSSYDNKSTRQAGAAQNSASSRKSSTAFRTISEVADDLGVQQHVLRFWETKFSQVKPLKRGGGRRYYRPEDLSLLQAIHHLLYVEGYTIKGVQKLLRDVGKKQIVASFSGDMPVAVKSLENEVAPKQEVEPENSSLNNQQRETLISVLAELKDLRGMIKPK